MKIKAKVIVNPNTNPKFCGAEEPCTGDKVGKKCKDDEVCDSGSCELDCSQDLIACDGTVSILKRIRSIVGLLYGSPGTKVCSASSHPGRVGAVRNKNHFLGGRVERRSALEVNAPNHRGGG